MRSFSSSALVVLLFALAAWAQQYAPYPEPDAGYVTDHANVLTPTEEERIEQWLLGVEKKSGTEIIVVTIDSIKDYPGTENRSLESFATALFNTWGIGNRQKNDGILLLVAIRDRRVRIELGAGHPSTRDAAAKDIIDGTILPRFRGGDYAGGITAGVKAIVSEYTTTFVGIPWQFILVPIGIIALLAIGVSLIRSGKRGWGWVFVGLALVVIVAILYLLVAVSRHRSRSSGWLPGGAGGFGGGFSRGGGASGSW